VVRIDDRTEPRPASVTITQAPQVPRQRVSRGHKRNYAKAVLLLFVSADKNVPIRMGHNTRLAKFLQVAIRRKLGSEMGEILDHGVASPDGNLVEYTAESFHEDILGLCTGMIRPVGDMQCIYAIGVSSGFSTIFPATIQNPQILRPHNVVYILLDGQFHDRKHYYQRLVRPMDGGGRTFADPDNPIVPRKAGIIPSAMGVHSSLTLSVSESYTSELELRTMVDITDSTLLLDFLDLHLAYIGLSFAEQCQHNLRDFLDPDEAKDIVATDVDRPIFWPPSKQETLPIDKIPICMTLTHGNPEAQFLCGVTLSALYQADSCLNCTVRKARARGFRMIIQS
jgi:hypothetical protein